MLKVSEHQLNAKFRSKRDLYKYLTEMCKTLFVYLLQHCSHSEVLPSTDRLRDKDFLKQILVNQKRLLHLDQVRFIQVPRYEELTVKGLLQ